MTKVKMAIAAGVLLVSASIAVAGPPEGLWNALLTKGAKWTIPNKDAGDDAPKSVTVEVVDTKALKRKPFFSEPPKVSKFYKRKDGGFVLVPKGAKGAVCFGLGATDPTCGSAPCYSYLCLDATGIVGVGGTEDGSSFGVSVSDNPY